MKPIFRREVQQSSHQEGDESQSLTFPFSFQPQQIGEKVHNNTQLKLIRFLTDLPPVQYQYENRPLSQQKTILDEEFHSKAWLAKRHFLFSTEKAEGQLTKSLCIIEKLLILQYDN